MLIDAHVHVQRPRLVNRAAGSHYPEPAELLAMLDAHGIDKAVCMARMNPEWAYTFITPEETLEICRAYPDRLYPLACVDPRMLLNKPDADFGYFLRAYRDAGCRGIGEYVANLPFDDPWQMNVFRQVAEAGLPLTFHIGPTIGGCYGCYDDPGLPRLERVLRECPTLVMIGHSQPFWAEISADVTPQTRAGYPTGKVTPGRVVELMRRYPNLYGDLSARSGLNALTRDPEFGCRFMEEFQDRLMFATDIANCGQTLDIVPYFREVMEKRLISPEAYEKIAWRNADRVFRLGVGG
jgi:predicted TIM-barrel fold metal-dependent hydrolase